ncbi:MAG: transcriptional regulator GutM [Thermoanaerobacteraceae bacterium]|nr:transcriptional regulator GutM [Thermoanaerobacteraceae bacterium]
MWIKLLLVIGVVWLIQSILTYFQIKDYQRTSMELAKQGRLLIGAQRGYLSKGAILVMSIDEKFNISDCRLLNGITVMARFKKFESLIGKNIFDEECKDGLKGAVGKAFEKALSSLSLNKGECAYGEITQVDSRE